MLRFLTQHRWELIIALGALALVLGFIGYWIWLPSLHDAGFGPIPDVGDVLFDSASLFVPGAAQGAEMPIVLEIARLLAMLVVGSAAVIAFVSSSRDRVQRLRIMGMDGPVVVCGLGQVGRQILDQLGGFDTVVIESDSANPNIAVCRSMGIPVIVGDAQQPDTLRSAGVQRAVRLFAVGPSDAVNAEIIALAQELAKGRRGPALRCLARIGDSELCRLLRIEEASLTDHTKSALDFFNLDDIAARAWLGEFDFIPAQGQPHILVSRLDGLGTSLVTLAAARWYADRTDLTKLWITVVDDRAEEKIAALVEQRPGVDQACRFFYSSTSVPDLCRLASRHEEAKAPPLIQAYVTADSDELALETALALHHNFDKKLPLVVEMWQPSGLGRLISHKHTGRRTLIDMFPSLQAACTSDLVRGGSFNYYEAIAIAIHECWRDQPHGGETQPIWDELDESRKESNRAQARDIPVKLEVIDCEIARIDEPGRIPFPGFTFEQVEQLARDEHKRWMRERVEDGWQQLDPAVDKDGKKNKKEKKTADLLPFDQLTVNDQDYDRNAIRTIPDVLKTVGYQVVLKTTVGRDASPVPSR